MRVSLLALVTAGVAWGAAPRAALTPTQMRLLDVRDAVGVAGMKAWEEGKKAEAIAALEKVLAHDLRLFGSWHRRTEETAGALGNVYEAQEEWAKAADRRRMVIEARRRLNGEDDWRTADARLELSEALAQARRTPAQRQALTRARMLNGEAAALHKKGRAAEALSLAKEAFGVCEKVGRRNPEYAACLHNLASLHIEIGEHKAAIPLLRQALELLEEFLGKRHPGYAVGLHNLATVYMHLGDFDAALPLARQALKVREEALGRRHPEYAVGLRALAALDMVRGDRRGALARFRQALALTEEVLGRRHPAYAATLNSLAFLHQSAGDYEAALAMVREAHALNEEVLGRRHPAYADTLNSLAFLHDTMGDHRVALPLYRQALKVREAVLGRRHPDYATSLHNLATMLMIMGDRRAALPLIQQALKVYEGALGRGHPSHILSLHHLGVLYSYLGEHEAALAQFREALKLSEDRLGRRHPEYATALHNLATQHTRMGDHRLALPLAREALKLRGDVLGRHPSFAASLRSLASIHLVVGDYEDALPLLRRSLDVDEEAHGRRHPSYAAALDGLAVTYLAMGRPGAALPLSEQALSLTRRQLALDASVQSERQQRAAAAALRHRLDNRLSIPDEAPLTGHDHVLAWKGAAFAAQQARRRFLLAEADPATRALALELREATRSLALLASREAGASRKRAVELAQAKEDLEARLALASEAFRLAVRPPSSAVFRAGLPKGVALIDFLVHTGLDPDRPAGGQVVEHRLVAWVVRADGGAVRVGLGPMGPVEKDTEAWRGAIEAGRDSPAAARLREKVWAPLERHLVGAKVALISPDGALGRLPFVALPGREKGKYLLEEVPLAVLPVPQTLPRQLERPEGLPSLLAVGGVDFGVGAPWAALPATGPEAAASVSRFRELVMGPAATLSGAKANKAALRDALPRHRFAHLATHGFFAPPSMRPYLGRDNKEKAARFEREEVAGWDPALLSGLVLAGANRPTPEDDGVLKASEVAEMDLSKLELAVLSACQTGLGMEAGGEGILGLQRAFAMAGCKSVVSSLWSVDDAATSVLMERFYLHLWGKKLSKLESLRQAQLDVMKHPEWVEARAKEQRGTPGLRAAGKAGEAVGGGKRERRSPAAWWAAWQLSGDWR